MCSYKYSAQGRQKKDFRSVGASVSYSSVTLKNHYGQRNLEKEEDYWWLTYTFKRLESDHGTECGSRPAGRQELGWSSR